LNIRIFYDDTPFRIKSWKKTKALIEKVISGEGKTLGGLNFILTTDKVLKEINIEFLKHNYNTDVISFNYGDEDFITGEVYVGIETVKNNAKNYKVSCRNELLRVLIHGTLHICGHTDGSPDEKIEMRKREDFWLTQFEKI
jgi:probable rRNA maturation factor